MGDLLGAHDAYEEGLKIDPNNAGIKNDLASVNRAMQNEARGMDSKCNNLVIVASWIASEVN